MPIALLWPLRGQGLASMALLVSVRVKVLQVALAKSTLCLGRLFKGRIGVLRIIRSMCHLTWTWSLKTAHLWGQLRLVILCHRSIIKVVLEFPWLRYMASNSWVLRCRRGNLILIFLAPFITYQALGARIQRIKTNKFPTQ